MKRHLAQITGCPGVLYCGQDGRAARNFSAAGKLVCGIGAAGIRRKGDA
ncbi:MAG: hypothetical protein LBE17_05150 [Treponema sp.]|nr:hypothetical protein [Treponema sp.]